MTKFSTIYEKWIDNVKVELPWGSPERIDIFKNPSPKELKNCYRGWISPKGDLYISSGDSHAHGNFFKAAKGIIKEMPKVLTDWKDKYAESAYNALNRESPKKVGISVTKIDNTNEIRVGESIWDATITLFEDEIKEIMEKAQKKNSSLTFLPHR